MPAKRIVIPAEKIAEGRFLYEQTLTPLEDIAGSLGICRDTLRKRAIEWGWQRRYHDRHARVRACPHQSPVAPDDSNKPPRGYPRSADERIALVERLREAVDKQIGHVDSILSRTDMQLPDEAERTGRMLAGLARTLREMTRLEMPPPPETDDDTDMPRNLDDLRRELLRKMDALIAEQSDSATGDS